MSRGLRRETLGFAITTLDTIGDWAALVETGCHTLCERLCARLDLVPSDVRKKHAILKES